MKRVTHQFKYYCGTQSQQKVCTRHRCVTIITELDHEQTQKTYAQIIYRKIPKISPGAYIFQKPFLRGLFLEGLIFGGAYLWREICVWKSIGLALHDSWKDYCFCFVLLCIWGQFPSTSPWGGLYLEGRFNGGFFALRVLGAYRGLYTWKGLFSEFYGSSWIQVLHANFFFEKKVNGYLFVFATVSFA